MTELPKSQRRGRSLAMSSQDLDAFLSTQRVCRLASVSGDGRPHNSPLWYVWDGSALWFNSIIRSQRWKNVDRRPYVSAIVDAGDQYSQLRGVEAIGSIVRVGEAPRTSKPDPVLELPEQLFADKYLDGTFHADGRHAWLRLTPEKIVSWDFRKLTQ
jgi:Pyridoxamine 5'-phosphate oxidase